MPAPSCLRVTVVTCLYRAGGQDFTPRQRAVYEIQNAMHLESVKALRPGIPYMKVYELSAQVMVEGLKELGLMKAMPKMPCAKGRMPCFIPMDWAI